MNIQLFVQETGCCGKYNTLEPLSQFTRPIKSSQLWSRMCANMSGCFTPAAADSLKRSSLDLIIQGQMPNGGAVVAFKPQAYLRSHLVYKKEETVVCISVWTQAKKIMRIRRCVQTNMGTLWVMVVCLIIKRVMHHLCWWTANRHLIRSFFELYTLDRRDSK